jgi:hypothetical protein
VNTRPRKSSSLRAQRLRRIAAAEKWLLAELRDLAALTGGGNAQSMRDVRYLARLARRAR